MDRTALAQKVLKGQPFSQHLGMELLSAGEEEVELALPVRPEFYQHLGVVQGGVIAALLDNALTFAGGMVFGPEVLTVEFKVNFLRPAKGQRLLARGRVVQAGKRLAVVQGEVYSEEPEPKLVALGQGTIAKV
ncbi:PaaI family thioesterase [Thermus tengchongensis]|uniref:Medium/long-chain acyl-CoA thioesterase YigI n=1 Tax=Thermus tengchongensis TaxID=1214928 RepID=A0A4Y9EX06_9DEIN|nr:PaaI family thioesterase [Thermus tengchongensis]TFU16758.1 PaaI family thioesterase [Thermus tengchongensis]TFU26760.1 PaaI family thioesterase [Thermus tengchongensis]